MKLWSCDVGIAKLEAKTDPDHGEVGEFLQELCHELLGAVPMDNLVHWLEAAQDQSLGHQV